MGEIWANLLLPKALKSCPKSNKSPNLVTLATCTIMKKPTVRMRSEHSYYDHTDKGSGCDLVGRVVASDTRGPWFDSSHLQTFISNIYFLSTILKRGKTKKKRPEMVNFFKKTHRQYHRSVKVVRRYIEQQYKDQQNFLSYK